MMPLKDILFPYPISSKRIKYVHKQNVILYLQCILLKCNRGNHFHHPISSRKSKTASVGIFKVYLRIISY